MKKTPLDRKEFWLGLILVSVLGISIITSLTGAGDPLKDMSMDEKRDQFIELKEGIMGEMMGKGMYRCCLEKACTYCIEKDPKHGEGAECSCLEDIVNGLHPCGECIGEILEGHGNPYLTEYFAKAIAEEVGEEHIETLRLIIEEKYDKPVEEQL